jgi:lipopolysaccharide/colanic/teichoic acid biosynthesis glycosyltransferase
MLKRLFDLVASALGIVVLFPAILIIAVAVRLDSPGPAFFRQVRVGRYGRQFEIFKFRSMQNSPPSDGPLISTSLDRRITRIGGFLRRRKLDELPQLFNVFAGDMSIVGPRPEVPKYVELYPPHLKTLILSVRPGITDEASLEFRNEGEMLAAAADSEHFYVDHILPRKLSIYARYAQNHTFANDIRIVWRTAQTMFR